MKILIVLIAGIGDLVLASKSIRAIRNGFPNSRIDLVTSNDSMSLSSQYAYIDHVWGFPIREMRKNKLIIFSMLKIIIKLRKIKYNTIINLHPVASIRGAFLMSLLFSMLRAYVKVGHDFKGFSFFLNKKIPTNIFKNKHYVNIYINIAQFIGGKPDDRGIDVFYDKFSEEKWQHLFSKRSHIENIPILAINPGGDRPNRRWHPDRFASVADYFIDRCNAYIIILGGPSEKYISQNIQNAMHNTVMNLAGKLSLNDLVYIIKQVDLLITNDSAPMHIAAALNTKQVAIFGPQTPKLLHPYTSKENYKVIHKYLECSPCKKSICDHISCLETITSEEVINAAKTLLANSIEIKK